VSTADSRREPIDSQGGCIWPEEWAVLDHPNVRNASDDFSLTGHDLAVEELTESHGWSPAGGR
jgi:hypothetical protein